MTTSGGGVLGSGSGGGAVIQFSPSVEYSKRELVGWVPPFGLTTPVRVAVLAATSVAPVKVAVGVGTSSRTYIRAGDSAQKSPFMPWKLTNPRPASPSAIP